MILVTLGEEGTLARVIAQPVSGGMYSSMALPKCNSSDAGEVIVICPRGLGDLECLLSEVNTNIGCIDRWWFDVQCGLQGCGVSDSNPPDSGEDGEPSGHPLPTPRPSATPTPPKPTLQQCQSAFYTCQDTVSTKGLDSCEMGRMRQAWVLASERGLICNGDSLKVWQGIPGYQKSLSFTPETCERSDIEGKTEKQRYCKFQFVWDALAICAHGQQATDTTRTVDFGVEMPIDGFGKFQLGGSASVVVHAKETAGIQDICSQASAQASAENCAVVRSQCEAKATDAVLNQSTVVLSNQELINRIDKQRLGLAGSLRGDFRKIQQDISDPDTLYRLRLEFLANWSDFVKASTLTSVQQQLLQTAFRSAQSGITSANHDLLEYTLLAWQEGPRVGNGGSDAARRSYERYIRGGEFKRRATEAENSVLNEVRIVLGQAGLERFKTQVWPGIYKFGFTRPMKDVEAFLVP